jgi:ankyrin repeat protein
MKKYIKFIFILILIFCSIPKKETKKDISIKEREQETKKKDIIVEAKTKEEEIFQLIRKGNLEEIKKLVEEENFDLSKTNYKKQTILHVAILSNQNDIIDYLLDKMKDFNVVDDNNDTYLHYAIKKQNVSLVSKLVEEKNVLLDIKNNQEKTPLDLAFDHNNTAIADIIFAKILSKKIEEKAQEIGLDPIQTDYVEQLKKISNQIVWDSFLEKIDQKNYGGIFYFINYPDVNKIWEEPEEPNNKEKILLLNEKLKELINEKEIKLSLLLLEKLNTFFFNENFINQSSESIIEKYNYLPLWAVSEKNLDLLLVFLSYEFDLNKTYEIIIK